MIIVQFEVAFDDNDVKQMPEAIEQVLEAGRMYGAAHVFGSFHLPGTLRQDPNPFYDRAVDSIELPVGARMEID